MGARRVPSTGVRIGWLFAVVTATAAPCAMAAIDAAGARILYFETLPVLPAAVGPATRKPHAASLSRFSFDAYGRRFELSLGENSMLTEQLQAKPGSSSLQLYRGQLDGVPRSWVRLGIKGTAVHGMIWDGAELYVIEPVAQIRAALVPPLDADEAGSAIFRLADVLMDPTAASCAANDGAAADKGSQAYGSLIEELKNAPALMQAAGASQRLEISVLGDSMFRQRHASEQAARDQILLRLNNLDGIFSSQLGIEIQVPSMDIDNALSNSLSDSTSPSGLLTELGSLRKRTPSLRSRGLSHLFTGRDLDGTTVGIAYVGSLCDHKYGVGLTEINNRGTWVESLIAAHEIGHNFGAVHDGDPAHACATTPAGLHLMSSSINGSDRFSQCSLDHMQASAQAATCITALPPANIEIAADLGTVHRALGQPFEWDLTITNSGGTSASDVLAQILVSPVVAIDDAYVVGGSCTRATGAVQCQLGDLPGGVARVVHLTLRSYVPGSNSISARVSALNETLTLDNDGDGAIVIGPEADLEVSLQAPGSTKATERFELGFAVVNRSAIQATSISIVIELPAGVAATAPSLTNGSCVTANGSIQCTLQALAPDARANGTVSINAPSAGNVALRARVSGGYIDPNTGNDQAEITVNVTGIAAPRAKQRFQYNGRGGGGSSGWMSLFGLMGLTGLRYAARRRAAVVHLRS